jgi:hypothetical protein
LGKKFLRGSKIKKSSGNAWGELKAFHQIAFYPSGKAKKNLLNQLLLNSDWNSG